MTDTFAIPDGPTLRMIADRILVRIAPLPEESASGLILPRSRDTVNNTWREAEVLAVGPGKQRKRGLTAVSVKPGDRVLVHNLVGTEIDTYSEYEKTIRFGESQLIDALRLSYYRVFSDSDDRIQGVIE